MATNFNKKNSHNSDVKEILEKKKEAQQYQQEHNFRVSFQYLDSTQKPASGFKDWQNIGLLSKSLEVLQGYCCRPLQEQIDGHKFALYGSFPPRDRTKFKMPEFVPEDANWPRIHVTGVAILAGYIVRNTFYIVFLDKNHHFYLTNRVIGN